MKEFFLELISIVKNNFSRSWIVWQRSIIEYLTDPGTGLVIYLIYSKSDCGWVHTCHDIDDSVIDCIGTNQVNAYSIPRN